MVDRWYPSSKTCSACGVINAGLTLSQREWECTDCGAVHERDKNAATNILAQSLRDAVAAEKEQTNAAGAVVSACGAVSSGSKRKPGTKLAAVKQEVKA